MAAKSWFEHKQSAFEWGRPNFRVCRLQTFRPIKPRFFIKKLSRVIKRCHSLLQSLQGFRRRSMMKLKIFYHFHTRIQPKRADQFFVSRKSMDASCRSLVEEQFLSGVTFPEKFRNSIVLARREVFFFISHWRINSYTSKRCGFRQDSQKICQKRKKCLLKLTKKLCLRGIPPNSPIAYLKDWWSDSDAERCKLNSSWSPIWLVRVWQ